MQRTPTQNFSENKLTAKCVLISQERFCVALSGFSEDAIKVFKTIPSRCYDPKTRNWSFLIKDYECVMSQLNPLRAKIKIERLPVFILNCLKVPKNEVAIDYNKLDPVLSASLMPFQVEGLSFGIDKNGRCLIADDMGLGKTFQALAIANYYKEDWPLLVVTTSSMKTVWEETIRNYLPSVSILEVQYMVSGKDYIGDSKILIISHDMMSRCLDKLLEKEFSALIIDESHVLKSFKTKCFKSCNFLAKKARRVILLSGTPALSRPSELFTQLSILDDKFFGSFFEYSKRYCEGKQTQFGWDASGRSNLQELEIVLAKKFMIRRTKEDVMQSLPNKTQEVITLDTKLEECSEEDRQCLLALARKYNQKKADKHAILLSYFSETAKIKIPSVCSYILKVLLESKTKFLVFAHHQIMLNAIEDVVKGKDLKYIRIDGNTTSDQRKHFISKFQFNDNYRCAILSITATNAGITLTAAQLVLFAELHWNPSILSQAEARAHRIGQENSVVVRYLLAPDTADDTMWLMIQQKQETLRQVGLCKDSFDNVTVKKQESDVQTKGLKLNVSGFSGTSDIRTYFTPEKKRKHSEVEDAFDDGLDDILCEHTIRKENELMSMLDDGLDELLCDIDF